MTNKDLEDNIDEIFKYVGDNGYHENRGARVDCDSCKRVEKAKSRVTALISQLENEARKDELNRLDTHYWGDDDTDVYLNKVLTPYIDDRIATLNKENTNV